MKVFGWFWVLSSMVVIAAGGVNAQNQDYLDRQASLVPLDELIPSPVRKQIDRRKTTEPNLGVPSLPATPLVDLRSHDTPIKHQFGGTCSAFGLVAAMENALGGTLELSERHAWSKYGKYSVYSAMNALTRSGVVEEEWWPQTSTRPKKGYVDEWWYKISQSEYYEDNLAQALTSLEQGYPLYFGVSTPQDMLDCEPVISPNTKVVKKSGHAFAVVGYRLDSSVPALGGGYFLVKNSWGADCGEDGYQWFPFSLCSRGDMYCVIWSIKGIDRY